MEIEIECLAERVLELEFKVSDLIDAIIEDDSILPDTKQRLFEILSRK